jgi:beta-glucosidase-like glycosyl hydrolase
LYNASPFPSRTRCADPRWGRNIESAGEDPFVSGQYAANFIQGFEHATETPYPLQASACCKHFVAVRGAVARAARALRRARTLATRHAPAAAAAAFAERARWLEWY